MPQHRFAFAVTFRFPAEAGQKVAEQTIVAFDSEGFRLGLYMLLRRNKGLIGLPIVRHDLFNQRTLDGVP